MGMAQGRAVGGPQVIDSCMRLQLAFLAVLQVLGSAVLFGLVAVVLRFGSRRPSLPLHWDVITKAGRYRAYISARSPRSLWLAFFFATTFYYGLPLWWWMWGFGTSMLLILFPIGTAVVLGNLLVVPAFESPNSSLTTFQAMLITTSVLIPLRVIAGFYVGRNRGLLQRRVQERRGWSFVACIEAESASLAIKEYRGESTDGLYVRAQS
jgi:hypothetical protein